MVTKPHTKHYAPHEGQSHAEHRYSHSYRHGDALDQINGKEDRKTSEHAKSLPTCSAEELGERNRASNARNQIRDDQSDLQRFPPSLALVRLLACGFNV